VVDGSEVVGYGTLVVTGFGRLQISDGLHIHVRHITDRSVLRNEPALHGHIVFLHRFEFLVARKDSFVQVLGVQDTGSGVGREVTPSPLFEPHEELVY
jgi:hypothetical protein